MNRLRKIVRWLWLIKERIVLATVVAVLCYRVYKVINPDEPEVGPRVQSAGGSLRGDFIGPKTPPPQPQDDPDLLWSTIWSRNMLTYSRVGAGGPRVDGDTQTQVELLRIQTTERKGLRAQIRTGGRQRAWYGEGEKFETFELVRINADDESITIYDESIRETKTVLIN